jgi:MFS family permease
MERSSSASSDTAAPVPIRSGWAGTFHSLSYRNYRLLWVTSLMVSGGVWLQQVTLGWLAYQMTESALQVGGILGVRSAPLILAPITGVLVDRFDRRKLLMVAQVLVTTLVFGFSLLLFLGAERVWHLYTFALCFGLIWAVNNPVRQTLVANSVPREALMNATALSAVAFNSMRTIGPGIGGVLIVLVGPALNFFIQGLLFLSVVLLLIPYRAEYGTGNATANRQTSAIRNLLEGFQYVLGHRPTLLVVMMSFVFTITLLGSIFNMLPVYVAEVLENDRGDALGLLMTALGAGGVVGTILMARFSQYRRKGIQALGSFIGAAISVIVLAQVNTFWAAAAILALYQVFSQGVMTTNMTMVQSMTPDHLRGRVIGLYQMEIGLMPIGGIITGAIATQWGIATAFFVGGAFGLLVSILIAVFSPSVRRLHI